MSVSDARDKPQPSAERFGRTIQQLISVFVEPEVRRRQEAGEVEKPFPLRSFQIVMFADARATQVRLNEEVNAVADALIKPGVVKEKGDPIFESEVEGFERLRMPADDEPDAAHATVVKLGDDWLFAFDFRYNKPRALELLGAAEEFLETAVDALASGRMRAFVDTLFSAAELTAHGDLMLLPLHGFAQKASHRAISTRVNKFTVTGRIPKDFRDTFNRLAPLRDHMRYLKSDVGLDDADAGTLLTVVRERLREVKDELEGLPD